jgi:immune inhibitor A
VRKFLVAGVLAALAVMLTVAGATAAGGGGQIGGGGTKDGLGFGPVDLPGPLALKQRAAVKAAIQAKIEGKIPKDAKIAKVGSDKKGKSDKGTGKDKKKIQFVELERKGEDNIWSVLMQFGTAQATHNHGGPAPIAHAGTPGPMHNAIPSPDRSVDNTTIWAPDFSKSYYQNLLFSEAPGVSSMRNFYIENSSGQYAVKGTVENWVDLPFNEAAYGSNYCGSIVCVRDIQRMLEDGLNGWYQREIGAGKTAAEINTYLAQFDVWDRYDYNGNGNFNEPDGYIDHFQAIHAGEGEETGGGAQGTDAIWSHRSQIIAGAGTAGPALNKSGGVHIGGSNYWVGDYTVEPENGGVGVFAHEFGHDLGIPDEYDTSGNTGGAENSTGFWTPWSSGSYGSDGTPANGIGNRPFSMSAWDKLQFGWLDYQQVNPGDHKTKIKLGPSEAQSNVGKQAALVALPDLTKDTQIGPPFAGAKFYYSGTGDDMDNAMIKQVTLPTGTPMLSAKARYNIEADWDYAYLIVSTDGGAHWDSVHTNLSSDTSPNGQNFGEGITGVSTGSTWVDLTANLSAYAGQTVRLGFEYWTDGAAEGNGGSLVPGIALDNIQIPGQAAVDGAESDAGWTFDPAEGGFHVTTGVDTQSFFNAYVVENRQYIGPDLLRVGFDGPLGVAPYNFGGTIGPDWAERHPYDAGVVIWYWNTQYNNNNVGDHPGAGEILPVDAHPKLMHWNDGSVVRARIQSYDSAFGVKKTSELKLHLNGVETKFKSQPGQPQFDDRKDWWTASDPGDLLGRHQAGWIGVNVPKTGTKIKVKGETKKDYSVEVEITPAKSPDADSE